MMIWIFDESMAEPGDDEEKTFQSLQVFISMSCLLLTAKAKRVNGIWLKVKSWISFDNHTILLIDLIG